MDVVRLQVVVLPRVGADGWTYGVWMRSPKVLFHRDVGRSSSFRRALRDLDIRNFPSGGTGGHQYYHLNLRR